MCRAGGRRCPSHSDPVAIAARNARRRATYAKNKKNKSNLSFEKTGDEFLDKLLAGEHLKPAAEKEATEKKQVAVKKSVVKKTTSAKPAMKKTTAESKLEEMLTGKKTNDVPEALEKKDFELLELDEKESADASVLYNGESVSLKDKSKKTHKIKKYTNKQLFANNGVKKYNPILNVEISENNGHLVDTHYLNSKKVSGVLDYTKLAEIDDSELGFNKMSAEDEDYSLNKSDFTDSEDYLTLSQKEMETMDDDDKAALRYFTTENYKWMNKALFNKEVSSNMNKTDYDKQYSSFSAFLESTDYNYKNQNVDSLKKITKALDKALEKGPKKQRVLYRGVNKYAPMFEDKTPEKWVEENYAVGKEVVFDGYQSASANPAPALGFSSHSGIIYEILTPEGANVSSESDFENELEITIPRGQRYTVSSIQKRSISNGSYMTYNDVTIIRLIAINSKGEVLDGTNSDPVPELTDDYFKEIK